MSFSSEYEKFSSRASTSCKLFEENKKLTPFGVNSNYRVHDPFPLFIRRAKGSRVWDADNNEYIDFNMAFGALVAGHSHPILVSELKNVLENGTIFGHEPEESVKLAKIICRRFNLDMVRFNSTGMEVTMYAARLARAYTGRNKIMKFEGCYHGSCDGLLVSVKPHLSKAGHRKHPISVLASPGLIPEISKHTVVAQFNDVESVEEMFRKYGDEIAGVILEPVAMNMGVIEPEIEFLKTLRDYCNEYNSVLIFDEVKTCGKWFGGAEERYGIKPDLKTLGKAIGGGIPLSALGGRKEIMELFGPGKVSHAGTFNANPFSVKAGIVTLEKILTRTAMEEAARLGEKLAKGYKDMIEDSRIKAIVSTIGISGAILFTEQETV
ncbi:MAG: aminotransferase class III-fold pyridoxal phosphate-dependent enzyme, partial [Candidatus Caldarchaeales archaeon]